MAKFNIEVELDWLNEANVDDVIKQEVLAGVEARLINNIETKAMAKLSNVINDKAELVVDAFINNTLESKIEDIKIPQKTSSWSSEVEYTPIAEFIGKRYERFLTEKRFDEHGREPSSSRDRRLSISEYFINNYLEKELSEKVSSMIQTARKDAEETIVKALEGNLKEQLSSDIIERLNIPKMLESLQQKSLEFGSDEK